MIAIILPPRIIPARAGFTAAAPPMGDVTPDHPRSRGVYLRARQCAWPFVGSSPLARGLRAVVGSLLCAQRIIPARAGFTAAASFRSVDTKDHPRSRGVYGGEAVVFWRGCGSSPLARGLPKTSVQGGHVMGIIPARAGFTPCRTRQCSRSADHPRSRGVYGDAISYADLMKGSSPLARGLRARGRPGPPTGRIIPARAGFTRTRGRRPGGGSDHPRSRGVYRLEVSPPRLPLGSSPLARGLPRACEPPHPRRRIIPARAGFTPQRRKALGLFRDHPRSRGVYFRLPYRPCGNGGSSPLARGLHDRDGAARGRGRIIPARAGFTPKTATRARKVPDHPRSRGVYISARDRRSIGGGSSPLARGLPSRAPTVPPGAGIIPARAGFTPCRGSS